MKKIVDTVCDTMFGSISRNVERVCPEFIVDFDRASKCGLAASISNCLKYVETRSCGHSDDIVISYTEHDNAIHIFTTSYHDGICGGYSYKYCISTEKKNQIEVTTELCMGLEMALIMVRGR